MTVWIVYLYFFTIIKKLIVNFNKNRIIVRKTCEAEQLLHYIKEELVKERDVQCSLIDRQSDLQAKDVVDQRVKSRRES